jgi:thiamine biosynthesis protein ThiI
VRTGGEIGIKSKPVRSIYEKILLRTIRRSLKEACIPFSTITRIAGRIYINTEEGERAALVAAKTFGVSSASAGIVVKSDLETIVRVGTEVAEKVLAPGTFAVRCRRIGNHPYTSPQVAALLGESILGLGKGLKVDLTSPSQVISVEIRDDTAIIYTSSIRGPDGYPLGTQETFVGIVDETAESVLASWCMMKRGSNLRAIAVANAEGLGGSALLNLRMLAEWVPGRKIRVTVVRCKAAPSDLTKIKLGLAAKLAKRKRIGAVVSGFHSPNLESVRRVMDSKICVLLPLVAVDDRLIEQWSKMIGVELPDGSEDGSLGSDYTEEELESVILGSDDLTIKAEPRAQIP